LELIIAIFRLRTGFEHQELLRRPLAKQAVLEPELVIGNLDLLTSGKRIASKSPRSDSSSSYQKTEYPGTVPAFLASDADHPKASTQGSCCQARGPEIGTDPGTVPK
jgi:hypothetical protein